MSCPFPGPIAAPAAQLSLLPEAGNCFIVTDFLTAAEENIWQEVPSEQEILITLGRSFVFSKVFPAVEILVTTLRSEILWG